MTDKIVKVSVETVRIVKVVSAGPQGASGSLAQLSTEDGQSLGLDQTGKLLYVDPNAVLADLPPLP